MEFVDIAGIVKGASEGAGLGNKFLGTYATKLFAFMVVTELYVNNQCISYVALIIYHVVACNHLCVLLLLYSVTANIRQTDAIVHLVRCFVNDDIIHVDGHGRTVMHVTSLITAEYFVNLKFV